MAPTSPQHAMNVLAGQFAATLQRSQRQQRTYVETLGAQTVRDGNVQGFIDLTGEGEVVAHVAFPISFMDKPLFTCGLELGDNSWLSSGTFPIWSATVAVWDKQKTGESNLYIGATVGIVTIGAPNAILHYSFQARSYTAPTGSATTVASPL